MSANTTVYSGNSGVVKFDVGGSATVIASVTGFTITQNADTIESSAMGSNARTYLPGMTNFSGSIDVNFIEGDAAQAALYDATGSSAATLEVYPSGNAGIKLNGEILITSHAITSGMNDPVTASISFQGTGALTKTII